MKFLPPAVSDAAFSETWIVPEQALASNCQSSKEAAAEAWEPLAVYFGLLLFGRKEIGASVDRSSVGFPPMSPMSPSRSSSSLFEVQPGSAPTSAADTEDEADLLSLKVQSSDRVRRVLRDLVDWSIVAIALACANEVERLDAGPIHQLAAALHGASLACQDLSGYFNRSLSGVEFPRMTMSLARKRVLSMRPYINAHRALCSMPDEWYSSMSARWRVSHEEWLHEWTQQLDQVPVEHTVDWAHVELSEDQRERVVRDGEYGLLHDMIEQEVLRVALQPNSWPCSDLKTVRASGKTILAPLYKRYLSHQLALRTSLEFLVISIVYLVLVATWKHVLAVMLTFYDVLWIPFRCLFFMGSACEAYPSLNHGLGAVVLCCFLLLLTLCQFLYNTIEENGWSLFDSATISTLRQQQKLNRLCVNDKLTLFILVVMFSLAVGIIVMIGLDHDSISAIAFGLIFTFWATIHMPLVCTLKKSRAIAFQTPYVLTGVVLITCVELFVVDLFESGSASTGSLMCFYLYLVFYFVVLAHYSKSFPDIQQNRFVQHSHIYAVLAYIVHCVCVYLIIENALGDDYDNAETGFAIWLFFTIALTSHMCFGTACYLVHQWLVDESKSTRTRAMVVVACISVLVAFAMANAVYMKHNALSLTQSQTVFLYSTALFSVLGLFFAACTVMGYTTSWTVLSPCPDSLFIGQPLYRLSTSTTDVELSTEHARQRKRLQDFSRPVMFLYLTFLCVFLWSMIGQVAPPIDGMMNRQQNTIALLAFCITLCIIFCYPLYHSLGYSIEISKNFTRLTSRRVTVWNANTGSWVQVTP